MSCINNNIFNLNLINSCRTNIGGIKRLFIGVYNADLFKNLKIINNNVTTINYPIQFTELLFNKTTTKYSEKYNYIDKKYEQTFELDLIKYDFEKRQAIDSLNKSKLVFIFQDMNGKYNIIGEKTGITANNLDAFTDTFANKSGYLFKFFGKSDYLALGINEDLINQMVNCADLDDELCLSSILYWKPYENCLIGDLDDFINP